MSESLAAAFARLQDCGLRADGTCDQCERRCMWHPERDPDYGPSYSMGGAEGGLIADAIKPLLLPPPGEHLNSPASLRAGQADIS